MTEKSAKFHEMAAKRAAAIVDQLRIFSNLHNPSSYDWTPEEVETYFAEIEEAALIALDRFRKTKRWREARPGEPLLEDGDYRGVFATTYAENNELRRRLGMETIG